MFECMLRDFDAAHGLRSIALRYFNAAGADPNGEIGEDHDPETHLIPLALDAAASRRPSLTIFGADYDTPDGSCIRDYIHVSDLADAHVLALRALEAGAETDAFNLGIGRGYSVLEVVDAIARVAGRRPPVVVGARRAGDPAALVRTGRGREQCAAGRRNLWVSTRSFAPPGNGASMRRAVLLVRRFLMSRRDRRRSRNDGIARASRRPWRWRRGGV
jgi:UDP-glucose 4-epimerase